MPLPKLLVIADDLTGANDAGVQFAVAGIRSVVLAGDEMDRLPASYPVVVVNIESRHLPPGRAAERVRRVAQLGIRAGVKCFYKKTDSTLRGNIGVELEALLQATRAPFIPFVPALPDLGRVTRDGVHYVHGLPVAETAFANDPLNPVRESHVAALLAPQTSLAVCQLKPDETPAAGFRGIAIFDCESNQDLAEIARGLFARDRLGVLSGSVALAKYVVEYLDFDSPAPDRPEPLPPLLFVNGSLNERSLEQIQAGGKHFSKLQLGPEQLIGGHADLTIPPGGGNLLLYSIEQRSDLKAFRDYAREHGLSEDQMHHRVAHRMGRIVHEVLIADVYRTLVVFGGDTLAGIARASHWQGFVPCGEIQPGLSVALPLGSQLTVISKAGGFGEVNVVDKILEFVNSSAAGAFISAGQM